MRNRILTFAWVLALSISSFALNKTTTVAQVTATVTLSDNVDYVISGTTPFTEAGLINITNTDHAVVIFQAFRPSKALELLKYITINGLPAVNNENCQVKMYGPGSIIMPYAKDIKPLTVYSEQNFEGISVNSFGLEHSGGYMNTLTEAKLNNKIRSFKLKRGYMVTFSLSAGGRGYSRCFIADKEDLEMGQLPDVLDKRISSYRIFKWNDAEKKGLANNTGWDFTQKLNASWCYSFGLGEDRGIDCECVPHKIDITWPTPVECGTITYSPHLKTNNEPGNQADHGIEKLEDVLATWEDLMATGKRLCSPSSHDGSISWMDNFFAEIDKRGWRCDIVDVHSYWTEGTFNGLYNNWYNKYKRPIWISEFVWGASWNNNGIFGASSNWDATSQDNEDKNYNGMKPILDKLNGMGYVERYAYWNSERNCSRVIYNDGTMTKLGNYYASMNSGIGYDKQYEYVPKVVYQVPAEFTLTYDERLRELQITWTNKNMELSDSSFLEIKMDDGEWQTLQRYTSSERRYYVYNETFPEDFQRGVRTYRVHNYDCDGTERFSEEAILTLLGAKGEVGFQYGTLHINNTEEFRTAFTALENDEKPAVFISIPSYNNTDVVTVNTLNAVSTQNFTVKPFPWNAGSFSQTLTDPETTDFMVLSLGEHQVGNITLEVGESSSRITNETTWIDFTKAFPEGVTPIVMATVVSRNTLAPYMVKISGITNKGFNVKLARQKAIDDANSFAGQKIYYVAATPGTAKMNDGKILNVGANYTDKIYGRSARNIPFLNADGAETVLYNPIALLGSQTDNLAMTTALRLQRYNGAGDDLGGKKGIRVIRQKDDATTTATDNEASGDYIGWIAVCDDPDGETGIAETKQEVPFTAYVFNGRIIVNGAEHYNIYNMAAQMQPPYARLPKGIYIVKAGKHSVKVMVP